MFWVASALCCHSGSHSLIQGLNTTKTFVRCTAAELFLRHGQSAGGQRCFGYTLQVFGEIRSVFSWHSLSNLLDFMIMVVNSFQTVRAEKLKKSLLKLAVQKRIHKRFWLAEQRQHAGWYMYRKFLRYSENFCLRLIQAVMSRLGINSVKGKLARERLATTLIHVVAL